MAETSPSTPPTSWRTQTGNLRLEGRTRARPVLRSRRILGSPLRRLHSQGRRVLWLPVARCRLHSDRLPLAWEVSPANKHESTVALPLIDAANSRGFAAESCALDKGYDVEFVYKGCEARNVRPIMPLRITPAVKREPDCEHGRWTFAVPTSSAMLRSGAARPGNANRSPSGSRPTAATRSSRVRQSGGVIF
jgi:hypothetical protein